MSDQSKPTLHDLARESMNIFTAPVRTPRHALEAWYRKRYAARYRRARLWFCVDLVILAVGVLLIFTAIAASVRSGVPRRLAVSLTPVGAIRTSDIADLAITITNHSPEIITDAQLVVDPGQSFVVTGASSFPMGTLARQESKIVRVKGLYFGQPKKSEAFIARLEGKTANGGVVHEPVLLSLAAEESAVAATIEMPKIVPLHKPFAATVRIVSTSQAELRDVTARAEFFTGFREAPRPPPQMIKDQPREVLTRGETRFAVPELLISDAYDSNGGELVATVSIRVNGRDIPIATDRQRVRAIKVPLRVSVRGPEPVVPGLNAAIALDLQNTGSSEVRTNAIRFKGSPEIFNPAEVIVHGDDPRLGTLAPGRSTEPILELKTRSDAPIVIPPEDVLLRIAVDTIVNDTSVTVEVDPIVLTFHPSVKVTTEARYFSPEGDQLGRGPDPPRVGKKTTYWVFVTGSVAYAPLENPKLEITLPKNVTWAQGVSLPPGWSPPTQTPTGTLLLRGTNLLPHNDPIVIGLSLAITPTQDQIGAPAPLVFDVRIHGTANGLQAGGGSPKPVQTLEPIRH